MRKIMPLLLVSLFLIGLPASNALSINNLSEKKISTLLTDTSPTITTDPPSWAVGNFTGVWGLNILGQPQLPPQGLIIGYYGHHRFLGGFTNTSTLNGYLAGLTFGPFMIGIVANVTGEGRAPFVGLGGQNTTSSEFYYRIMGIVGPTLYLYGIYTPFP